jgi:hypothetical protein
MKTTYTIINAEGEKYYYLSGGFESNLAWHQGHPDKDGFLSEVLMGYKWDDPQGYYEIIEHYKG